MERDKYGKELTTIAVIGGGNMGQAFAAGLLKTGLYRVVISDPDKDKLAPTLKCGAVLAADNVAAVKSAAAVILAVKPQVCSPALLEIRPHLNKDAVIISIAAGITLETLGSGKLAVVRAMPNLCALNGMSMTSWIANKYASPAQLALAKDALAAVGKELQVADESAIDGATAVAGSGPAYLFYLAEQMINAAQALGFSADDANLLTRQTLLGAAAVLGKETRSAAALRVAVTSKGGTTEAALLELSRREVGTAWLAAITAAATKAQELGQKNR